jgi:hypothetical protein
LHAVCTAHRVLDLLDHYANLNLNSIDRITKNRGFKGEFLGRVVEIFEGTNDGDDLSAWQFKVV